MTVHGYFDYNATTPVCEEAAVAFANAMQQFGNPSSKYSRAGTPKQIVDDARSEVARLINAKPDELSFTSGGTEANNWAIKGAFFQKYRTTSATPHIITSAIEHASVLETCAFLEETFNCEVTRIPPNREGIVDAAAVAAVLRPETTVVSVMLANNEVGAIQPVKNIAEQLRGKQVHFHVDAVQAVGKIPVDAHELGVDTLSFSGHKFYAPKGIGGLYIKTGVEIASLLHGGGQEKGLRGGTEPVALAAALAAAAGWANAAIKNQLDHARRITDLLRSELLEIAPTSYFHGPSQAGERAPNTLSLCIPGVRAEALAAMLDHMHGIQVSLGSACSNNKSMALSHVLVAMGLSDEAIKSTLRVSVGRYTTEQDVHRFVKAIQACLTVLARIQKPASSTDALTA